MKEDEKKFFITCLNYIPIQTAKRVDNLFPRDIINILSQFINYKRCWYFLEKWSNKGFYNYGTTLDLGWFEPEEFKGEYLEIYNAWRYANANITNQKEMV